VKLRVPKLRVAKGTRGPELLFMNWNYYAGTTVRDCLQSFKIIARARHMCQLEAVLDALLAAAPPLFELPFLNGAADGVGGAATLKPTQVGARGRGGGGGWRVVGGGLRGHV
jgi:hypothetical protein